MKLEPNVYSIDANVILRYLLGDDPILFSKAHEIFKAVEVGRTVVTCDPVNLAEVVWVLSSFYKLKNEQIYEGLEPIINSDGFLVTDKERYILALKMFANGIKSFGDACACATAIQNCDGRLYSFDTKLSRIPGIVRSEHLT